MKPSRPPEGSVASSWFLCGDEEKKSENLGDFDRRKSLVPAAAVIPALGAEALGAPATINGSSFPLPFLAPWAGHVVFWAGSKRTHE